MPVKNPLQMMALTAPQQLQTLTENRRIFNLKSCELNVFESYESSFRVPLTFGDFVITSMVRGKKIMHLSNQPAFDYLPGETVIVPANETMVIDFPEATASTPTQCIALTVDSQYISNTVGYLNTYYNSATDEYNDWKLQFPRYHFDNDTDVTELINKLIRVCSGSDKAKNIYADLSLKELLIRILQSQQLLSAEEGNTKNNRLPFILQYIREHLTEKIAVDDLSRKAWLSRNLFFKWFREQVGITPLEYINRERVRLARQFLAEETKSLAEISTLCGFNDLNYFVRVFRRCEGITPGAFRTLTTKR